MAGNNNINKIFNRFYIVYGIIILIGIAVVIKIIQLQFFTKDKATADKIYNEVVLEAKRGSILACDGRPLAFSMPFYEIRMDCTAPHDTVFNKNVDKLAASLSKLFRDKSASAYASDLKKSRKEKKKYRLIGNRSIDYLELRELEEFPIFKLGKFKGGLIVRQENKRTNPYGSLAYRTVGYVNKDGGGVGLEKSYNYKLEGKAGKQYVQRQLGGDYIPVVGIDPIPAIDGYDIRTTIDIDIQEAAEIALRDQLSKSDVFEGGTAIVMEVSTGAVRAIANMKKMGGGKYDESFNYAIAQATEPGSTLKLAALISLLEDGHVTLDTPIDGGTGDWYYNGTKFSEASNHGYGLLDVKHAFAKSSNICFAKLTSQYYEKDPGKFVERFTNMKIGEKFGLELEGEGRSTIHTPSESGWSGVTLPMMGIGYAVLLTPLHTLTFYNAVANDGKMVKPYFVEDFEKDGIIEEKTEPQIISGAICSKKTIAEAKKALRAVVEEGTAKKYDDPRYKISGKTGTAQIAFNGAYRDSQGNKKHQASFAGFFPSDNPKYSCIVVMYTGKTKANFYGGTWATPVFKQIADKIFTTHPEWSSPLNSKGAIPNDYPNIAAGNALQEKIAIKNLQIKNKPTLNNISDWVKVEESESGILVAERIEIERNIVPDVRNMGLKDALYILENEGYRVSFKGSGRVMEQSPLPGAEIARKGLITLILHD